MNYDSSEPLTTYQVQVSPDWGQISEIFFITQENLVSLDVRRSCFMQAAGMGGKYLPVSVGQANAGELNMVIRKEAGDVFVANLLRPLVSQQTTSGFPFSYLLGVYRVDKVVEDENTGLVTVHAFDKMADADAFNVSFIGTFNNPTDITLVNAIAAFFNFSVDSSVTDKIVNGYRIPNTYHAVSCREMLKQIAAAYGGAFYVDAEKLCFVDLLLPIETNLLIDHYGRYITFGGDRIIVNSY